jgi:hypothetical protein
MERGKEAGMDQPLQKGPISGWEKEDEILPLVGTDLGVKPKLLIQF